MENIPAQGNQSGMETHLFLVPESGQVNLVQLEGDLPLQLAEGGLVEVDAADVVAHEEFVGIAAGVGNAKRVADLFAGIGTFALRLAERARTVAVDSEASAVKALERAAQMTSGLKPVQVIARDLFRSPFMASELKAFDAVVFDPPRQGAEAQARELAKSNVKTIVAVSCDATTFARDAAILVGGGYKLASVTPVDQFRYSYRVEVVAKFEK